MGFTFEKLVVYQKALVFADDICTLTREWPRGYFFLASELTRVAVAIPANIAEGNGRFNNADKKHFFGQARGSVFACVPLLEMAKRQNLVQPEHYQRLRDALEEVSRMSSGLIHGGDRREERQAEERQNEAAAKQQASDPV